MASHTSDPQRRSAPKTSEPNVQVIFAGVLNWPSGPRRNRPALPSPCAAISTSAGRAAARAPYDWSPAKGSVVPIDEIDKEEADENHRATGFD